MTLFITRGTEDDSLPMVSSKRRIDEESPTASAPPPFAESVPLPLHQTYKEDHHRNHSRRTIKPHTTAPSESKRHPPSETEQRNVRKGACNHLAYALFLLCIVWPLAFVSANLWILTK